MGWFKDTPVADTAISALNLTCKAGGVNRLVGKNT